MTTHAPAPLPDATKRNWVDRYAPAALQPWLKLGRLDRPIGIWLLFLPGAMGLAFAIAHPFFTDTSGGQSHVLAPADVLQYKFPWLKLILFAVGSVLMRAAGCAFNDFVDRDFDARVERTRGRPIPSGQISPKQALAFTAGCSLISFLILIQLGWLAIWLGVGSLALVAAYPFMKRITWWPQAWLGLTFNWGFLMGYATITDTLTWAALVFYAGLVFWTIGYDTIYALQDIEDDAMIGVKSSARALGKNTVNGVSLFYGLAAVLTGTGAYLADLPALFFGGLLLVTAHLFWQVVRLRLDDNELALKLFKSNRTTGLLWVISLLAVHFTSLF
ncbi:4-hydroxybenzoate octaprenyltransferase [Asticcacaulis sp. 201]|uniref:4-hydroxybenzoate octaprenyltransferase n=1 Tax=Asticcacaulis sp. 201 TaxID=3028787 RepID=UPI002916F4E5|nr:4-hydroxybenzoate octaprenyltransferase [Asticcacaulis sp. 201]MDV6332972.1 4-hydroxybenzoate octaprenyltransferase [Asticcacaulis sp. 201]